MPLVNYDTKADFDAEYSLSLEPPALNRPRVKAGYTRAAFFKYAQNYAANLHSTVFPSVGITTSSNILFVGAGFAWTAEILESTYGYTNIVPLDTSPYIQDNQDLDEEADINAAITAAGLNPASGEGLLVKQNSGWSAGPRRRHSRSISNEDMANPGSRKKVRDILGQDYDWGISEEVISTLSDTEITDLLNRISQVNNLASMSRMHITSESPYIQPPYQVRTIEEWKLAFPTETFVSIHDWQVV